MNMGDLSMMTFDLQLPVTTVTDPYLSVYFLSCLLPHLWMTHHQTDHDSLPVMDLYKAG